MRPFGEVLYSIPLAAPLNKNVSVFSESSQHSRSHTKSVSFNYSAKTNIYIKHQHPVQFYESIKTIFIFMEQDKTAVEPNTHVLK